MRLSPPHGMRSRPYACPFANTMHVAPHELHASAAWCTGLSSAMRHPAGTASGAVWHPASVELGLALSSSAYVLP